MMDQVWFWPSLIFHSQYFLSVALSSEPTGSDWRRKSLKTNLKQEGTVHFVGDCFQRQINPHVSVRVSIWGSRTMYVGLSQNKLKCGGSWWWRNTSPSATMRLIKVFFNNFGTKMELCGTEKEEISDYR